MISITKKEIDNGAVYKLEVCRDDKCIYEDAVKITGGDIDEEQRDRIARLKLVKEFEEGHFETVDWLELLNLIPLYKEETK